MTTRPEIPTQDGWAVEMHGECVLFCNNSEKATGISPGAKVRVFSEAKLRAYANACVIEEIARLQAQAQEDVQRRVDLAAALDSKDAEIRHLQAQVEALAGALQSMMDGSVYKSIAGDEPDWHSIAMPRRAALEKARIALAAAGRGERLDANVDAAITADVTSSTH